MKTKRQFGLRGRAMMSYLISGISKARGKWADKYNRAQTESERMYALMRMNQYAEAISMYSKMMKGGLA